MTKKTPEYPILDADSPCPYHSTVEWSCVTPIDNGFRCTRPVGHDGDHVACGVDLHALARSPQRGQAPEVW